MRKVEKIMEKIIGNEQEIKELLSKETVDDLYEFFLEKDNTLTMEEFDDEVYDILEDCSKISNKEIDQNTLEKISGGKNDFLKKTLATSLSALSIGCAVASPVLAAGTSRVKNGSRSIAGSTKNKIKGRFAKIGKWFSAHKKAVAITGGTIGAAAIGAAILAVAIKHKNADNSSDVANSEKQNINNNSENSPTSDTKLITASTPKPTNPASSVSTGDGSEHIPQQPGDIELKDMGGSSSSAADASSAVTTASPEVNGDSDSSSSSSPGRFSRFFSSLWGNKNQQTPSAGGSGTDKTEEPNSDAAPKGLPTSPSEQSSGTSSPSKEGDKSPASKEGMSFWNLEGRPGVRH